MLRDRGEERENEILRGYADLPNHSRWVFPVAELQEAGAGVLHTRGEPPRRRPDSPRLPLPAPELLLTRGLGLGARNLPW